MRTPLFDVGRYDDPTTAPAFIAGRETTPRLAAAARWHLWPGRNFPATAAEEAVLVEELTAASPDGPAPVFGRGDVTALMNVLRCGIDLTDARLRAPGLVPARLLAAYRHLDERRRTALDAWRTISAHGDRGTLLDHAETASVLLPIVITDLLARADRGHEQLAAAIHTAYDEIARVGRVARTVEEWMIAPRPDDPHHGSRVGRLLYDLDAPALWDHQHFAPPRVGTLVPTRLAALLGERPSLHGSIGGSID